MSPRWLTSLVRARRVQEDFAKQQLATAERSAHAAHARVRYDSQRLDSLIQAGAEINAPAFVAAAVALQAAGATHAAAVLCAERAVGAVEDQRLQLLRTALARRTAEQMHEREVATERELAAVIAQRELDEVAARVHLERAARGRARTDIFSGNGDRT